MGMGGGCVCLHVKLPHGGKDGVRPEECVNLDQEESTQRACMHNVNWTLVPPSSFSDLLIKRALLLQSCYSDRKKASNLEAYVEWFNRLSYLVATEICMVSPELLDLLGGGGQETWGTRFRAPVCASQLCIRCWGLSGYHAEIKSLIHLQTDAFSYPPAAGEEETQSPCHRVLHRRGPRVLQHRQLQLPHGHHM